MYRMPKEEGWPMVTMHEIFIMSYEPYIDVNMDVT